MKNFNVYTKISLLTAVIILMAGLNLFSQGKNKMDLNAPLRQMLKIPGSDASKDYCIPYSDCSYGDGFEIFELEEIENLGSGCSPDGYGDFTAMETPLTAGVEYIIYVVSNYGENNISVWIDFNDDEEFAPDEMLVDDFFVDIGGEVYEIPITIPSDAQSGFHRLRARANYLDSASDPCADFIDGETEDYTVEIESGNEYIDVGVVSIDIPNTVAPGNVPTLVTLKNYGNTSQTLQLSIVNELYGTCTWVNDLLPGEERQISYGEWYLEPGTYVYFTYFSLDGDENESNNSMYKTVLAHPSVTAFGYTPYELGKSFGSMVSFDLSSPGTFNFVGASTADELLTCACWYNNMIYAIDEEGDLYSIDPSSGAMTFVAATEIPDITGLAYDGITMYVCTGIIFHPIGLGFSVLFEMDPLTGETTAIDHMGTIAGKTVGIACDSAGNLYGYDYIDKNFLSINKTTGEASLIGNVGITEIFGMDISIDKSSNSCYLAGIDVAGAEDIPGLFMIDITTGQATSIGEFQDGMEVTAFAIPDVDLLPPQNLLAQVEGNTVFLSWDALAGLVDGYNIYRDGQLADTTTESVWTDLCLLPGEYEYTVTAVFEDAESGPSFPANAIIDNCNTLLLEEGFEAYTAGQQLVVQAENMGIDYWQCWSTPAGSVEDPFISDAVVFEGSNAMLIEGLNDVVMELGGKTEGKYSVTFKIYVPSGFDGFFGIWRDKETGAAGMEAYFNEDETGSAIIANSDWQYFTYEADAWMNVEMLIDLDNDWARLYLNANMICQAQWSLGQSGEPGPLKLDIIDFWAGTMWGGTPQSFVDQIEFLKIMDELLPPENLQATTGANSVTLTWDAPMEGMIEYVIHRDGNLLGNTAELNFSDEGLEPGEYQYEVIAVYGDCESLPAGPVVVTIHPFQVINIPAGWSGLSSCIDPLNPDIETIFQPIIDELIILQSETGMYWPGENVNTLINWDTHTGYKIKVNENVSLILNGPYESNKTIQLAEGWNVIPVLSECDVNVVDLFAGQDVVLVKEVAGNRLYWPVYGINSLEFLLSGRAYFVLMESEGEIVFPECNLKSSSLGTLTGFETLSGFKATTPNSHTLALPTEAVDPQMFGKYFGAFNQNNECFGWAKLNGENTALTIFGDDPTTLEQDGFTEGEILNFKIWDDNKQEFMEADVSFDPNLPHYDGLFKTDGISAIGKLKSESTSLDEVHKLELNIYPNPACDYVNINIGNLELQNMNLELINMQGRNTKTFRLEPGINHISLTNLEKGIYLVRIVNSAHTFVERLIVE